MPKRALETAATGAALLVLIGLGYLLGRSDSLIGQAEAAGGAVTSLK